MFVAYLWLVIIVSVSSPEVVSVWEAVVTLLLLPILVVLAYMADVGWLGEWGKTLEVRIAQHWKMFLQTSSVGTEAKTNYM